MDFCLMKSKFISSDYDENHGVNNAFHISPTILAPSHSCGTIMCMPTKPTIESPCVQMSQTIGFDMF